MQRNTSIAGRVALTLAASALIGLVALIWVTGAPDAHAREHSLVYIANCPGTVSEEGPGRPVAATVATTADQGHLVYHLDMVYGTADPSDVGYQWGLIVTSNPDDVSLLIADDDFLDDGETFLVAVGSTNETVGRNSDQRCTVTIIDNDPPRVVEMRLVSEPADGDIYRLGEEIEIEVEFDNKVRVAGDAAVRVWFYVPESGSSWSYPTNSSHIKKAAYVSGSESQVLTFAYEVRAGDWDSDGLVVPPLGHSSLGEGAVKWAFDDRDADHFTRDRYLAHKVDGGS